MAGSNGGSKARSGGGKAAVDERIDKRRVTMKSVSLDAQGNTVEMVATDYVRPELLEAYVADAQTRWQFVSVSDEPDAGPAGYDGDTAVPEHLAGKRAADFVRFGGADRPENALDEHLGRDGSAGLVGVNLTNGS